jgi:hypothetical protein
VIDWAAFFQWVGYDFVGVVLSLFGGFYAFFANRNAKNASLAAEDAVKRVTTLDAVSELAQAQSRLREVRARLDQEHWDRASDGCADIRILLARVISVNEDSWSEDTRIKMGLAKKANDSLSGFLDAQLHRDIEIDLVKAKQQLGRLEELVATLHVYIREKVTGNE